MAIGEGVLALEISADLHPVSPASSKSVIAQVQFYDAAGQLMDVAPPQLRHSEKVGGYFYPYDYVQGDAFRFIVPSPDGAARAEVVLRHWRKLDTTPYRVGSVSIHPVDPIAAPRRSSVSRGGGEAWSAERTLREAIKGFAAALTSDDAPLSAHEAPFGEAVVEHFIFETKNVAFAKGLARRRLQAGRDRDALALLPLASDPLLAEAASRRALLQWAMSAALSENRSSLGNMGGVVVVAQDADFQIQDTGLSAVVERGWPLEIFAANPPAQALADGSTWCDVEAYDATDADQIGRLADQVVRAGRGRDLRMVWAISARDAIAAAAIGRRLALPVIYDMRDSSAWAARMHDREWLHTDEGQREEAIFRSALRAADRLLVPADADWTWLSAFLDLDSKIFTDGSGGAMLASLASSVIRDSAAGTGAE